MKQSISRRRFTGAAASLGATALMSSSSAPAQASGRIKVMGNRVAVFYAPLIGTVANGFLKAEGLDPEFSWMMGRNFADVTTNGSADVLQNAVSSSWAAAEGGRKNLPVHIAQINARDGFFLVRRGNKSGFDWKELEGKSIMSEAAGQPLIMLRYGIHYNKVDLSKVNLIHAANTDAMYAEFKSGKGDYIQLQGPAPQRLEMDGAGKIVASVGGSIPEVAFSSVCASREFVSGPLYRPFLRAFSKSRQWCQNGDPKEIAEKMNPFLPEFGTPALAAAVATYQKLGNWKGGLAIPRDLHDRVVDVFLWAGAIQQRHAYEEACVTPPANL
jgi:NitT/TauT family transport system substrate-binding protein